MKEGYRIVDEPIATGLQQYTVNPVWPLLSLMLAGTWLALPWFLINSHAMGSATRGKELRWILAAPAVSLVLLYALAHLHGHDIIPPTAIPYGLVVVVMWKLAAGYMVFMHQNRSFALHQYFGGQVRNGLMVLLVGSFLLHDRVLGLYQSLLWIALVG